MGRVRAIVSYRLIGDIDTARDLMKRVANYTNEHFGDRLTFDPFVNEASGEVIWVNTAADEDALVEWEADMGDETGFRDETANLFEFVGMYVLDPITDPRLEHLRDAGTAMTSMLD